MSDGNGRLRRLRQRMAATGLDGFLVTSIYNIRYLSGFTGSTACLFLSPDEAVLITDFRYDEQAHGEAYRGVTVRVDKREALVAVADLVEAFSGRLGFEGGALPFSSYEKLDARADSGLVAVDGMVEKLRAVKDDDEIGCIREAAKATDRVFTAVLGEMRPGMTEIEVAARVDYLLTTGTGEPPAFRTIVASGERGALPHARASDRKLAAGDLVTMDFGASWRGYCADMTRTVAVGAPDSRQREVYDTVLAAQLKALEGIRAGITGKQADALARDFIAERGFGEEFGHGLGHGLGLEVHEAPRLAARNEDELAAGMVVTVEPGVYIPGWGGVRIEDDVVVQEGGSVNLTSSEKKLIEIGT